MKGLSNKTQRYDVVPSNETRVETKKLWESIDQLSKNLTMINKTLSINITWIKEDWANDHVMQINYFSVKIIFFYFIERKDKNYYFFFFFLRKK